MSNSTIEVGLIKSTPLNTVVHVVLYFVIKSHKLKPTKYTVFMEKYPIIYNLSPTHFGPYWAIIEVSNCGPHKPSIVYSYSQTVYIADDGVIYHATTHHTHTHTHTHTHIYIYIWCVCVCVRYLDTKFLTEDCRWVKSIGSDYGQVIHMKLHIHFFKRQEFHI